MQIKKPIDRRLKFWLVILLSLFVGRRVFGRVETVRSMTRPCVARVPEAGRVATAGYRSRPARAAYVPEFRPYGNTNPAWTPETSAHKQVFIYEHDSQNRSFSPEFQRPGNCCKYGDFIKELDHSTGRIMKAIRDAGLDDDTLVVFTSDNGPTRFGSTGSLAGGKYCTMEGRHRVPGIFRWPGVIPSGQVSGTTISSMDLLPLFCELAGVEQPSDRKIDGENIFPILQGNATESPHEFLYYYNGTNLQAVREGNWKLHLPRTAKDQPFWSKKPNKTKGFVTLDEMRLFDLKSDVGEKQNVAGQHPEVVARLQKQAEAIRAELGDVRKTGTDQRKINLVDPQER